MALAPSLVSLYTPIIDRILATSDLETISAKRIRAGLQDQVDHDISSDKEAITALIMARFDLVAADKDDGPESAPPHLPPSSVVKPPPSTNGTKTTTINGKRSSPGDGSPTAHPSKKHKTHTKAKPSIEDLDREYAARLQAEEMARARSTRGGGTRQTKKAVGKKDKDGKKKKKKSKAKVGSDDDSDLESGPGAKKKDKPEREKKGGFHKLMLLSPPLATLLGEDKLSRPQTVKKIWEHIKANDLQDQADKRMVICDEAMRAIFKQEKVHMFTMNKILGQNLYDIDEVTSGTTDATAVKPEPKPLPKPASLPPLPGPPAAPVTTTVVHPEPKKDVYSFKDETDSSGDELEKSMLAEMARTTNDNTSRSVTPMDNNRDAEGESEEESEED